VAGHQIPAAAAAALAITIAAMFALRPIAWVVDLVDRPGGHKTHHGEVPIVGGLAMLLGLVLGLSVSSEVVGSLSQYVVSVVLLVVVGSLDDRFDLPPVTRLAAQFAAVLPMFFGAGVQISSFGDLFGLGAIRTGSASLFATAFVTLAAINAFNMLDGLDGLAGGVAAISLGWLLYLTSGSASLSETALTAVLLACVVGFLVFNVPIRANRRVRCFMGDAGSTLLGFSLAWLCIGLSQAPTGRVTPITMVWIVGVPATDVVWTTIRRLARRQSPLRADNEHLHHSLRKAGIGVRGVFAAIVAAAALFGFIGTRLQASHAPEWLSFALLVVCGVGLVIACRNAQVIARLLPEGMRRPASE
jgi:UDP-GlcNAc:undecaprenyl-phosphate/decaprenyl-phosphate GlcNAc-1-phosphate transferase